MSRVEVPEARIRVGVEAADHVFHELSAGVWEHGSLGTLHLRDQSARRERETEEATVSDVRQCLQLQIDNRTKASFIVVERKEPSHDRVESSARRTTGGCDIVCESKCREWGA